LYIAIDHIILLTAFLVGSFYSSAYLWNVNVISGKSLSYGFFVAVFSICLFLHFKQGLLLEDRHNQENSSGIFDS